MRVHAQDQGASVVYERNSRPALACGSNVALRMYRAGAHQECEYRGRSALLQNLKRPPEIVLLNGKVVADEEQCEHCAAANADRCSRCALQRDCTPDRAQQQAQRGLDPQRRVVYFFLHERARCSAERSCCVAAYSFGRRAAGVRPNQQGCGNVGGAAPVSRSRRAAQSCPLFASPCSTLPSPVVSAT